MVMLFHRVRGWDFLGEGVFIGIDGHLLAFVGICSFAAVLLRNARRKRYLQLRCGIM
jgi:hypothetical protein